MIHIIKEHRDCSVNLIEAFYDREEAEKYLNEKEAMLDKSEIIQACAKCMTLKVFNTSEEAFANTKVMKADCPDAFITVKAHPFHTGCFEVVCSKDLRHLREVQFYSMKSMDVR